VSLRARLLGLVAHFLVAASIASACVAGAAGLALAASPSPTTGPAAGDPRSAGQGPGLVGDPLLAIGLVLLVAVVSLGVTLAYVRLTADRGQSSQR